MAQIAVPSFSLDADQQEEQENAILLIIFSLLNDLKIESSTFEGIMPQHVMGISKAPLLSSNMMLITGSSSSCENFSYSTPAFIFNKFHCLLFKKENIFETAIAGLRNERNGVWAS